MSISDLDDPPDRASALGALAMLRFLPDDVRRLVEDSFVPVTFPFGTVIVREADPPDAVYVLTAGTARVVRNGDHGEEVPLNFLRPGDSFGEQAFIADTTRSATVRASTPVEALRLDGSVFRALLGRHPAIRRSLDLAGQQQKLRDFLRMYSAFGDLPGDALATLLSELEAVPADAGQVVVRQGEPPGPLFVIEEGRLKVTRTTNGTTTDVGYLRSGDFFGERSLFAGQPRDATVEAVVASRLLQLSPDTYTRLLAASPELRKAIEQRTVQYEYRAVARVPLDFAEEILPADLGAAAPRSAEPAPANEAPSPVDDDLGPPARNRRRRRFPQVWQVDEMDCGAACVAMVCRHFGRAVSLTAVRRALHTSTHGTSLLGIAEGAEELGLDSRTVKASKSRLDQLQLPAVVHWEGNHWVVAYEVTPSWVRVADPARGRRRLPRAEFEANWSGFAALLTPTPALADAPEERSNLPWLLSFLRPLRAKLAQAVLLAILAAGLQMLIPVFSQVIVDDVVARRDFGLLTVISIAMVGVLLLATLATLGQRYLLSTSARRFDEATLAAVTAKLLNLPLSYFNARRTGDIEHRLSGMRQVRQVVVENGVQALTAVMQLLVAVAIMFVYSWRLALVYLLIAPLYALLIRFARRRLRPMFDTLEESFGRYRSRQIDAIKGIETVKALGAEARLEERMLGDFRSLGQRLFRADFLVMSYQGLVQVLTFLSLALFLYVGALQVLDGALTIGELVSFNALVVLANGPIAVLLFLWDRFQRSSVLISRLSDILEEEPEQGHDRSQLRPVRSLEGRVRFQNVSFRYGGPGSTNILDDVTFEVAAGTTVAIVGRSGSGKTTLIKCLAGLLTPTEGTILYDGIGLETLDHRDLRRQIGFVLQENYLFDDTIAANIALGGEEPDMERVLWASRLAAAHGFIQQLPLSYETKVGESGLLLSGGQRQRIAIARAVYHRPPILIFDEATSSLDTESERAVKENLDQLLEGRTSFVIAHRLSTIRDADTILVLERGRMAEQGTHDELMDRRGLYYYLTSQQLDL